MKNKSVTYLLIGVVLFIWGLVFYRFFNATQEEETFTPSGHSIALKREKVSIASDTFELILDYRDPFLGKTQVSQTIVKSNRTRITKQKISEPKVILPPIDWSFIAYKGAITNKLSKKEIGIFRINNEDAMMSANDRKADVLILKVTRDSALILYKGIKKGIFKEF